MRDFSHLNIQGNGLQVNGSASHYSPERRWLLLSMSEADTQAERQEKQLKHSSSHLIAVSQEARNNPVLALKLIERGKPHQQAIETLAASHRHLSHFTMRKMKAICSGWEFLDTQDRNNEAFIYSSTHKDSNGYRAGLNAALKVLDKYVEPWTAEDLRCCQSVVDGAV